MLRLPTLSRRGAMHMPRACNDSETGTASAERRPTPWYVLTRVTKTTPSSSRASSSSLIESIHTALRPHILVAPLFLLCLLCVVLPALAVLLRFLRHRRRCPKSIYPSSAAAAAAAATVVVASSDAGAAARTRAVEDVRRRLSGRQGLLSMLWNESVRVVWDIEACHVEIPRLLA